MVESRWAMTKLVRSARNADMACWTSSSVRVSTELVASSRISKSRVGQEGPGDGDELLLACADAAAFVVDDGVVSVREAPDEPVDERGSGGGEDVLFGGVGTPVGDVVADRPLEEPGVLQHHPDLGAQVLAPQPGDVDAVEGDAPGVEVVEPHDEVDQRGLAGAGRSDDGNRLTRLDAEAHVLDQRLVLLVPEGHILEPHPAVRLGRRRGDPLLVRFLFGIE